MKIIIKKIATQHQIVPNSFVLSYLKIEYKKEINNNPKHIIPFQNGIIVKKIKNGNKYL